MRKTLLLTAAVLAVAFAPPAFAQTAPSTAPGTTTPSVAPETGAASPVPHPPGLHRRLANAHARHVAAKANADTAATADAADTGGRPGHSPGVGDSEPASNHASNISGQGSHSAIAPRLPAPASGDSASPRTYLRDAARALDQKRTGAAQEALERAETSLLNNPAYPLDPTAGPSGNSMQRTVEQARVALGQGDTAQAKQIIGQALAQTANRGVATGASAGGGSAPPGSSGRGMAGSSPGL